MKKQDRAFIYESNIRRKYGYNEPDNKAIAFGVAVIATAFYLWWAYHCA